MAAMITVEAPGMITLFPGPLTNEEYFALPESKLHIELFEGRVMMAPAPTPDHQEMGLEIASALRHFSKEVGGRAYIAPVDIEVGPGMVYQPDVMYFAPESVPERGDVRTDRVPDIAVEVLSPGTRRYDLVQKMPNYGKAGVREFWVVDPLARTVEVYANEGGEFGDAKRSAFGEPIPSGIVAVGDAGLGTLRA
jgi:Uma2 family endonuclease